MNRRHFLGSSALGGVGLVASQAACARPAVAPAAPPPPVTGNEPFELHEATIDDLQAAMRAGTRTARSITELYLARIEALNRQGTGAAGNHRDQPRGPRDRRPARCRTQGRQGPRPAARHPRRAQGQHRHARSDDHHRGLAGAGGLDSPAGLVRRAEAARSRSDPAGEGQHERVGLLARHECLERMERARRPVPQSLCPGSHALRIELRLRVRGFRQSRRGHHRHRDGRVDHLPLLDQRHRRAQADGGPVEPRRHHPDLALTGLRGTDDPHGARRRHPPRRRLRRGPPRSRHVRE